MAQLENYPAEKLTGELGLELVGVIDNVAKRFLQSQQYKLAEQTYQKVLTIVQSAGAKQSSESSAGIYHNLGRVAQEQQQWEQANTRYQQAVTKNLH